MELFSPLVCLIVFIPQLFIQHLQKSFNTKTPCMKKIVVLTGAGISAESGI